jgi:hypothetical protein
MFPRELVEEVISRNRATSLYVLLTLANSL